MERSDVERIMRSACWDKNAYSAHYSANEVAKGTGDPKIKPYKCPFHTLRTGRHWHVGHVLSIEGMTEMAEAIRWCGQHDEAEHPTPPTELVERQRRWDDEHDQA